MDNFEYEYSRLNSSQKLAVDQIEGPVLVVAGPGTGKTQLLSLRVANILRKTDANADNILCLTFTEAAAQNMRDRLIRLMGTDAHHVRVHTFHSFGSDIIGNYSEYFRDAPLLSAVDELGEHEILQNILSQLPHDNSFHIKINDEFLHIRSVQTAIGWLKRAGLEPSDINKLVANNNFFIEQAEPLLNDVFFETPKASLLPKYQKLLRYFKKFSQKNPENSFAKMASEDLNKAIDVVAGTSSSHAKAITSWRNRWLKQDQFRHWIFADNQRTHTLSQLNFVYDKFQQDLQNRGLYTFDDMILRSVHALKQHEDLRLTLQEQYRYILVDEYQDTSGVQNQLLELLADNPINESQPNLMVVGDDDQAIYRFQGAHMSIMLDFINRWKFVQQVVLTNNYRSGNSLLNLARYVITQGEERLENQVPNLNKQLKVGGNSNITTTIYRPQTPSESDQYFYISKEILKLIKRGVQAHEIAILAPKHQYLQDLVPYLLAQNLPINYERREHILEQPPIREIIVFARVVQATSTGDSKLIDSLMPSLLAAEFWNIPSKLIWQMSLDSYSQHKSWTELMLVHPQLKYIAEAIIVISKQSVHNPFETIFDYLIGNSVLLLDNGSEWTSPYRKHYFASKLLRTHPAQYIKLLGQLTSLYDHVATYFATRKSFSLFDFVQFIDAYKSSHLNLLDTSTYSHNASAVQLSTVYKAKGLEWNYVFVISCHSNVWGSRARIGTYSFTLPTTLNWIKPARDSMDDRLRLFYVAITRAKQSLYLTCFQQNTKGQTTEPLEWLHDTATVIPKITVQKSLSPTKQTQAELPRGKFKASEVQPSSMRHVLQPHLDQLKLSATHLNHFLDLSSGGPKEFFFRHILHFPEKTQPGIVFGSIIHELLHVSHIKVTASGQLPSHKELKKQLHSKLYGSSLSDDDKNRLVKRGEVIIEQYFKLTDKRFVPSDKSELGFRQEDIRLNNIPLTGKIDLIRQLSGNEVQIIDYKTGKPINSLKPSGDSYRQIRVHLYLKQLLFYWLLLENSPNLRAKLGSCSLQFVEPLSNGQFISIHYTPSQDEIKETIELIQVVWQHIMNLDFPDTSRYPITLAGVKQFEQDLLSKKT